MRRPTRLLVADDHPIIVSGLRAALRDTDFEVVGVVTNGADVLPAVDALKPDMLVLDVSMPGDDGITVAGRLRARGDACRIVLLTAALSDEQLLRAVDLDLEGIVLKEDAPATLVRRLEKVRAGGRTADEGLLQRALALKAGTATDRSGLGALSPREQAVSRLVAEGRRNREIAGALGISEGTVKVHLYRIYEKLGVGNRTELAVLVRQSQS